MATLNDVVSSALRLFAEEALDGSWNGTREREAVSLFAFGTLLEQVDPQGMLSNPRQIRLEVLVPQVAVSGEDATNKKDQMCEDVVLWSEPRITCWDAARLSFSFPSSVRIKTPPGRTIRLNDSLCGRSAANDLTPAIRSSSESTRRFSISTLMAQENWPSTTAWIVANGKSAVHRITSMMTTS